MKRLTAALAALLLSASLARATTYDVVLIDSRQSNGTTTNAIGQYNADMARDCLLHVFRTARTNYKVIPSSNVKTEYLRTGVFVSPTGQVDSARCVVFASFLAGFYAASSAGCRPDSALRVARGGPQVPWLCLIDSSNEIDNTTATTPYFDDNLILGEARACSTGVSGPKLTGPIIYPYTKADPTLRWRFCSYVAGFTRNLAQSPAGGMRVVLGGANPIFATEAVGATNSQFPCSMPTIDQAGVSAGEDSIFVWDRLFNIATLPTAKTATFVSWGGSGFNNQDSLAVAAYGYGGAIAERGLDILMYGLAHFDSLTSGLIFKNMPGPRRLAVVVDGGLARNLRRLNIGIQDSDTASFYSTLDSLRLSNIPITFGVNVDSASSYTRDIIKLRECSPARFSPQVWTGIMDTTRVGRFPNGGRLVDIFGRWRQRAFFGDSATHAVYATNDTSIYWQLKWAKALTDSLFPGRSSGFCMPPMDDYSPINLRPNSQSGAFGNPSKVDSVLYVIGLAGFTGLRINGAYTDSDARYRGAFTNPRGWHWQAGAYRNNCDGRFLSLLAHSGYELQGGISWANSYVDSVAPYDTSAIGRSRMDRVMFGIWNQAGTWDSDGLGNPRPFVSSFDTWRDVKYVFEDYQDPQLPYTAQSRHRNAQIFTMSCSDLSGKQPDPARTGWLFIRWIDSWMKACNQAAGRTLMTWSYPEDIEP